jgi:hypothetical protein
LAGSNAVSIFATSAFDCTVEHCVFENNKSDDRPGVLNLDAYADDINTTINHCIFNNNFCTNGSILEAFQTDQSNSSVPQSGTMVVSNCLLANNTAAGGAIAADKFPNVSIVNSTIAENESLGISMGFDAGISMQNTVLYNPGYDEFLNLDPDSSPTSLGGNLIRDNSMNGLLLSTDIDNSDPLFMGSGDHYYQLQMGSPAVDAGVTPDSVSDLDLAGNARIVGGKIDIGAYELDPLIIGTKEMIASLPLNISPNPTSDYIIIDLPFNSTDGENQVSVFDEAGNLVFESVLSQGNKILLDGYLSGLYTVVMKDGAILYIGRFFKQ